MDDEIIRECKSKSCEQPVAEPSFVRDNVVTEEHRSDTRLLSCDRCYGSIARGEEGKRIRKEQECRSLHLQGQADADPVKRIERINGLLCRKSRRCRNFLILRGAGKQEGRILAAERDEFYVMPL